MKNYLTTDERNVIDWDLKHGFSVSTVAKRLKRATSTIDYEIKKYGSYYFAEKARLMTKKI